MGYAIGVDVGGTFTDIVLRAPDGTVRVAKCLSTHDDPVSGVVTGISQVLGDTDPAWVSRVVHATTLATNAVLERKGPRVAFVTTRGFRSLIPLGRYARVEEDRYDLRFTPPVLDVDCFEVDERVSHEGAVLTALDPLSVRRAGAEIAARGITSAAVCLLHSYAFNGHERQVGSILSEYVPSVVLSSEVWPELREYERATTTIMSAFVGPLMASYLSRLRGALLLLGVDAPIHVMESGGGVMSAELAARRAVATIESGPAAGVLAASAFGDAISFDMGGTTAKACVIKGGRPEITHEFHVGGKGSFGGRRAGTGVPVKTPAIDLAEVGAGGGSVAWVDAAGALRVGPHSSGSSPGPACYGLGGSAPTVTDANLLLGYLASASIPLSPALAAKAMDAVALPLGVSRAAAAAAVHEIVCASMASAVHVVTVQRGIDPRGFVMVAFGGAGPMHAARVAARFGISTVVVPEHCGVASAVGLLRGALSTDRVLSSLNAASPEAVFERLALEAAADLEVPLAEAEVSRSVDVRFKGQSHDLTVPWTASWVEAFYAKYQQVYGIAQQGPVEIVSYRIHLTIPATPPDAPTDQATPTATRLTPSTGMAPFDATTLAPQNPATPLSAPTREAYFPEAGGYVTTPVLTRDILTTVEGPAIIEDPEATIVVPPGWTATLDSQRTVRLTHA